jgi:hypothetical protein
VAIGVPKAQDRSNYTAVTQTEYSRTYEIFQSNLTPPIARYAQKEYKNPYLTYLYNVLLEYFLVLTYIQVGVRTLTPVGHTHVCVHVCAGSRTHNAYAHMSCACVHRCMHLYAGVCKLNTTICSSMKFFATE